KDCRFPPTIGSRPRSSCLERSQAHGKCSPLIQGTLPPRRSETSTRQPRGEPSFQTLSCEPVGAGGFDEKIQNQIGSHRGGRRSRTGSAGLYHLSEPRVQRTLDAKRFVPLEPFRYHQSPRSSEI